MTADSSRSEVAARDVARGARRGVAWVAARRTTFAAAAGLLWIGLAISFGPLVAYDVVVGTVRDQPVEIVAAHVTAGARQAEITLRNNGRKPVKRLDLRWTAVTEAGEVIGEQTVRVQLPKPLKRRRVRRQLLLSLRPSAFHHYTVEVQAVEFGDNTLWPAEAWGAHVRAAAERGEIWAWHTLGMLYRTGEGRPQDNVLAYAWLHLSATAGHPESIAARDELGAEMTLDEIEQAQGLSRTFAVDQLIPFD